MPTELFSKYPGLEKSSTLDELRAFIGDCQRCKLAPRRTNLVFGVGNPNADLMFVGEAPVPTRTLAASRSSVAPVNCWTDIIERGMGISPRRCVHLQRDQVPPPDNRNPEPDEVAACEPFCFGRLISCAARDCRAGDIRRAGRCSR